MKEICKGIFKLETEQERSDFFDNLFFSSFFKDSLKNKDCFIIEIRNKFIKYPRYFYHMQDKNLERAAFTSWYNVLSLKTYANKYIQDLYYLHELTHITTMPYLKDLNFNDWCNKMRENEVLASLESEVFIYFRFPELRKYTFQETIWADQFLENDQPIKKFNDNFPKYQLEIIQLREKAYTKPKDNVEEVLKKFRDFSFLFYKVWEKDYNHIESTLDEFYKGNTQSLEELLLKNQNNNGILFYEKVHQHYQNYLNNNNIRPHY